MKATELLANQHQLVHARITALGAMTREEWLARPAGGGNRAGFTAWHMVATRDWVVRAVLGGERPIGWDTPFAGTGMGYCEIPFGMPESEADAVAEKTSPADVIAYSAAVTDALVRWLVYADAAVLDGPPAQGRAHLTLSPRYDDEAYRFELEDNPDDMCLWPVWKLMTRPSFAHCIGHLTEIDTIRRGLAH